jgi:hypothetical protein
VVVAVLLVVVGPAGRPFTIMTIINRYRHHYHHLHQQQQNNQNNNNNCSGYVQQQCGSYFSEMLHCLLPAA